MKKEVNLNLTNEKQTEIISELKLDRNRKDASEETKKINKSYYDILDFKDEREIENAKKGLVLEQKDVEFLTPEQEIIFSQKNINFIDKYSEPYDTINPSLFRNFQLNHITGLFKVVEGIYQVRGYDISNITFIQTKSGFIVYDTGSVGRSSKESKKLLETYLGKPINIKAIIISHSHIDHFGGVNGLIEDENKIADHKLSLQEQINSGKIPIIVPQGFLDHAISENLLLGACMGRRASYQYGFHLDRDEKGFGPCGIGMAVPSDKNGLRPPTYEIKKTGEEAIIDGVKIIFHLTPGTEAPAEMNSYFPDYKALWMAENCTGTLHNLYTIRGAQIRDGEKWSHYINEAYSLFGKEAEVVFQSHNWPHWGKENIKEYLMNTSAIYKFINDQSIQYINKGYTINEISHMIKLPSNLEKVWYTRQYYGTIMHNSKAVYQKYIGWYDGNPCNLHKLPPSEYAMHLIEYIGDLDEVMRKAKKDYEKGDYQWVAELTNAIVFAHPEYEPARFLCADALEQLGYQAESGCWRNAYLTGALELRHPNKRFEKNKITGFEDSCFNSCSPSSVVNMISMFLDKEKMEKEDFVMRLEIKDPSEKYLLRFKYGIILKYNDDNSENADITLCINKSKALLLLLGKQVEMLKKVAVKLEGDATKLNLISENLRSEILFKNNWNIVEP